MTTVPTEIEQDSMTIVTLSRASQAAVLQHFRGRRPPKGCSQKDRGQGVVSINVKEFDITSLSDKKSLYHDCSPLFRELVICAFAHER